MIPDLRELRRRLIEIHGSPEADATMKVVQYIRKMQEKYKTLTCFYDIRGELSTIQDTAFFKSVWVIPSLEGRTGFDTVHSTAKYADLIVIDDITYLEGDMYRFFGYLRKIAYDNDMCIMLLNQRRFTKNKKTGDFEDHPYRYDVVEKYCAMSIDADTGENRLLNFELPEYDSFVQYLLDESCC